MASTKTIVTLALIAVSVIVAVHSHPTDFANKTSNVFLNNTLPQNFCCNSKLTHSQMKELENKNRIIGDKYLWTGGIMYYAYDNSVTRSNRITVEEGMQLISRRTCFTFKPRKNQKNYVLITTNDPRGGCFSYIGMLGGQQIISLDQRACMTPPTIAHELIHAIGFMHEHQRNDRDDYITVMYDNIEDIYQYEFDNSIPINTYGISYNVRSIMHHEAYCVCAIDVYKPVMVSKNINNPIPVSQAEQLDLTDEDANKINAMYKNKCKR